MSATVFWERVAYFYFKYNNAFVYVERDVFGNIIALWSIDPSGVRFSKISTGEILLIFTLNGRELTIPYGMIIHVARNVTGNALFGRQNSSAISRVINLINLNYKGIENAIMTSTFARFIGEYTTKVSDSLKEEAAKDFTKKYMGINTQNPVGIVYTDSNMKLTPITGNTQKTENYVTTNQWNQAVYKFYGCPEKVIAGTAGESEMTAYYERTIDTFLMRTAQECTRKIFTDGEFSAGNRIIYSDRKLQYLTMSTRLSIFQAAREIGAFTLGTLGDIIGLPVPHDKRNEIAYSQNYTNRTTAGGKAKETDEGNNGNNANEE
jgi:HK97 family phage portal protein